MSRSRDRLDPNGLLLDLSARETVGKLGTWIDRSGNNKNATLYADAQVTADGCVFDGTGDYLSIPNTGLKPASTLSLGGWYYIPSTYVNQYCKLAGVYDTSWNIASCYLLSTGVASATDKLIYFGVKDFTAGTYKQTQSPSPVSVGWHHLVGVADGGYVRLYVDSIEVGTPVAYSGVINTTSAVDFQCAKLLASYTAFQVDNLFLYSRALSPAEIMQHYRRTRPPVQDLLLSLDSRTTVAKLGTWPNYAGTLAGATLYADANVVAGEGCVFDGTGDYADCGLLLDGVTTFTLMAWIKHTSASTAGIITRWDANDTGGASRWLFRANADVIQFYDSNVTGTSRGSGLNNGQWHHVAVAITSGAASYMYIDGAVSGASFTPTIKATTSALKASVGAYYFTSPSGFITGSIDNVQVYNRALSLTEIQAHYNRTKKA